MPDSSTQNLVPQLDWPTEMGSDLLALVEQCKPPVERVSQLANLDAPAHNTAAFALHLADKSIIKGRRTWNEERARRICYFLSQLKSQGFPRVLAQAGNALLLEWVEGRKLDDTVDSEQLVACGSLLGQLHSTALPDDCPYACDTRLDTVAAGIETGVRKLRDANAITAPDSVKIMRLAVHSQPQDATVGIIHTDLCPENLVLTDAGKLRPIDNESLQVGYLDLDLARSWYRWPLDRTTGKHFLNAYSDYRDSAGFAQHFAFWLIKVLIDSAVYRLGSPSNTWHAPMSRLLAWLEQPEMERPDIEVRND